MKILKVIHGYPPRYNAGSEVYSQTLCQELAERHEVHVFTRQEDNFEPDYTLHSEMDPTDPRVILHVINMPKTRNQTRYRHEAIDHCFDGIISRIQPDVVHVGHLNHLSTSILEVTAKRDIPLIYTLHDYWLMCPRGQFIQRNSEIPWQICDGQDDAKCAQQCYQGFFSGSPEESKSDLAYWKEWVGNRMDHIRKIGSLVDYFIAPSQYLLNRYRDEFGLEESKLIYMDYGFERDRLQNRSRKEGEPFVFGYIGTHIPAKGIQDLIQAFSQLKQDCLLRIWGRPREDTQALKSIVSSFSKSTQDRIEWHPEYRNQEIVKDVFNHVDAIVVPSIWVENSPLVIHEALQVKVPVITADIGGMSEYVHHEKNGLLFSHRDVNSLAQQMGNLAKDPIWAKELGERGYLQSEDGNIPKIKDHIIEIENLYYQVLEDKGRSVAKKPGPWRITFDTNPDHCNFKCVMCECFSPHSNVKKERVAAGIPKREMSIDLIRKILEDSRGTPLREIIPSTMGEPLLYKDFEKIIDMCTEFDVKLNLTTNGSFPRKGAEEWAKLLIPVCSDIKISWNGATKETQEQIMLGSNWERDLNNLKTLIRIRNEHAAKGGNWCRITLQLTFLGTNVDELADIVRLGLSLGIDRIKGHHLWAHFKEIKTLSMRHNAEAIARWNIAAREAQEVAASHLLPNGKRILLENIYPLEESASVNLVADGICPFLGKEAWVDTTGRFNPCCAPDQERLSLGEFGNLNEKTMGEIWQESSYQKLRQNYLGHPLCISCNMRKSLQNPLDALST
jgi:glycosyltransferase involved in cell wall biosynthesis/MoaA/NifB/PqqE/SkfB family radical SAM enzyme